MRRFGEDALVRACFVNNQIQSMGGGLDQEWRTGITVGLRLDKELQR
ncbi:MAG TPA: hypothetical protein PLZ77_09645 [Lachnospiraceae bacterium]|nr:hypothetical protein [Lachnospiraceae bacterium]